MPSANQERRIRLLGNGKGRGGGLPLSLGFTAIVNTLLDEGPQSLETLVKPVEEAIWKPERVHASDMYPLTSYRGVTEDLLHQLQSSRLVERKDCKWNLTEYLMKRLGKSVSIIRKPGEHRGIFYLKDERTQRNAASTDERELRSIYHDFLNQRSFRIKLIGSRGAITERILKLHPLAEDVTVLPEKDFINLAREIKTNGILRPVTLFQGQILDGRHRVAIAAALQLPVPTEEFKGDEGQALNFVRGETIWRRELSKLSMPQRSLEVYNLYGKEAAEEAKERELSGIGEDGSGGRGRPKTLPSIEGRVSTHAGEAFAIMAARSNGLVSRSTLERMKPVFEAPRTQERIRRGEITKVADARIAALRELGLDTSEEAPERRRTIHMKLRDAISAISTSTHALMEGSTDYSLTDKDIEDLKREVDELEKAQRLRQIGEADKEDVSIG